MVLSETQKDLIRKSWDEVRKDLVGFGTELFIRYVSLFTTLSLTCFVRFFAANPDYKNFFPSFRDLNTLDEIRADKRMAYHAGRVTTALSGIVDNLDNPGEFSRVLTAMLQSHKKREIKVEQFENLRAVFIGLLQDTLGKDLMNEEASKAWELAYEVIVFTYRIILAQ